MIPITADETLAQPQASLERVPPSIPVRTAVGAYDQPRKRVLAIGSDGRSRVRELIEWFEPDAIIWLDAAAWVPRSYRGESLAMDKKDGPHGRSIVGRRQRIGSLRVVGLGMRRESSDQIRKEILAATGQIRQDMLDASHNPELKSERRLSADIIVSSAMRRPGAAVAVLEVVKELHPRLLITDADEPSLKTHYHFDHKTQILSIRGWAVVDMDDQNFDVIDYDGRT